MGVCDAREHQLAGAPGVLEAAAGAAMIEAVEHEAAGAVCIENLLGQSRVNGERRRPSRYRAIGRRS